MSDNKITNLPDPSSGTEPVTKKYADRVYRGLTDAGFVMKDNIGMGGHEIVRLNPVPSTAFAAVSKDYADTRYAKGWTST